MKYFVSFYSLKTILFWNALIQLLWRHACFMLGHLSEVLKFYCSSCFHFMKMFSFYISQKIFKFPWNTEFITWKPDPDVSSPDRSEFLASDPLLQMWIDTRVWASGLWSFSPDVDRYPGLWFLSGGRGQGDEEEEQLLLFFVSQEKFWWTHSAPAHRIKPGLNLD